VERNAGIGIPCGSTADAFPSIADDPTHLNVATKPENRIDPGFVQPASGTDAVLSARRPQNAALSLGLAVEFLRTKPAFAKLQFGEWSQVLISQIGRGHFFFVVDQQQKIQGFLGWALTHPHLAEKWIAGRSGLRQDECREGECVILNAWVANTPLANRFIIETARKIFAGKSAVYFKRHYPDGRTRPTRLTNWR
jgi:hemolysin-activating ACP:hemolysin acyltransferase